MRIGLFGGTFNPPHDGHRLASLTALSRLGLDRLWWMVTPGNPLKETSDLPALPERMAAARLIAHDPRIDVTDFEAQIGTHYTYDTLSYLKRRCPHVHFVWIMGADNLAGFHKWQKWQAIANMMPIVVIDRPGSTLKAMHSRAGLMLGRHRIDETDASLLARMNAPAFSFLHGPRSDLSSTELRALGLSPAKITQNAQKGPRSNS
jgi:nicotinate-nucleotide adenylyltransferase